MSKPMSEWLEHPDNQVMFEEIEDEMILMKSRGEFNDPSGSLNPDKFEAERNQRKSSLIEELIKEAPDEYLDKWDLQSRQLQNESDTATNLETEGFAPDQSPETS